MINYAYLFIFNISSSTQTLKYYQFDIVQEIPVSKHLNLDYLPLTGCFLVLACIFKTGTALKYQFKLLLNWVKGEAIFSAPKTVHSQRRIGISSDVIDVLEKHHKLQNAETGITSLTKVDLGLVFTNLEGGAMHPKTLTNAWWNLQDKAKVPRIRFHD